MSTDKTEPKGSASSSPDEIHKWKRCGCGHPQHSMKCRVGGTLNFCGCLALTSVADIAETCRQAGGCPEHPAEGETAGEPHSRSGYRDADEAASMYPEPEAHEHDWSDWGAVYHGGHFQWRDCEVCGAAESRKDGHSCLGCALAPEREAPELCHCGIGTPEECATGPAGRGPNSQDPRPPRRPPYAVAYAIEGGAQYEIALPGGATVRAVDGALVITHASAVLALTAVRPWESA